MQPDQTNNPGGTLTTQVNPTVQATPVVGSTNPAISRPAVTPPVKANANSTQNALNIAEIRDGIVIMNDGSFRSVVMVKSINFDLMSPEEREAVEYSYQGFLNSLYFPVQIFIHSQKVDLRPYIDKLDKIRTEHDNMLLALLMEDYIAYINDLSMQTNIMDKRFYVVIPFFPVADVQKAITASKTLLTGMFSLFKGKQAHVVINEADLEKAKAELEESLKKEIGEYKAKLQMTERGLVITFLSEVFFNSGKDTIRSDGESALQKVAEVLNTNVPHSLVAIEGHTDNEPIKYSGWKSNWELSSARALSVLHYLIAQCNISPKRLSANGYGEYRLVADNDSTQNRQKNRRVEIVILPSKVSRVKGE